MPLDKVLRKGVETLSGVISDLKVLVKHEPWAGSSNSGQPAFSETAFYIPAVVSYQRRLVRDPTGNEVQQHAVITITDPLPSQGTVGRREPIDPRDKLTLPDGHTGPILDIKGVVDPDTDKPYVLEISLG